MSLPLLGNAGWRLEGARMGDGRSKSGLALHLALDGFRLPLIGTSPQAL